MPTLLYLVWLLWIVNQHTNFRCQQISCTKDIRYTKTQQRFELSLWSWPWKRQSNFYTKRHSLWWSTMQVILVAKKDQQFSSYGRDSYIWSKEPCDPELEDGKRIVLHATLAHEVASPYQAWLRKVRQVRRYCPAEYLLGFWTSSVTLTLTTAQQSKLFTRQSTLWWCAIKPSVVAKGSAVKITY